jgi:hypothetical protein
MVNKMQRGERVLMRRSVRWVFHKSAHECGFAGAGSLRMVRQWLRTFILPRSCWRRDRSSSPATLAASSGRGQRFIFCTGARWSMRLSGGSIFHRAPRGSTACSAFRRRKRPSFAAHISTDVDSVLYEVESAENDPHLADMNNGLLNFALETFDANVIAYYWRDWERSPDSKAVILREVLLRSPVTVLRRL